jgi:hypothetical protein
MEEGLFKSTLLLKVSYFITLPSYISHFVAGLQVYFHLSNFCEQCISGRGGSGKRRHASSP